MLLLIKYLGRIACVSLAKQERCSVTIVILLSVWATIDVIPSIAIHIIVDVEKRADVSPKTC